MKSNRVMQIQLQVSTATWQQMTEARRESARLWNKMVKLHLYFRKRNKKWPTQAEFEKHFARKFRLHSQTIQALIGKFFGNIETTKTNRAKGDKRARYPYKEKTYFNPVWPVKLKNFAKRSSATDTGLPSIHLVCAGG